MAYTPINWQTGDAITAEKLNRCDNGWSVANGVATVFNDSVTTTDANNREVVIEPTEDFSTASEIVVILDNVTYNLTGFDDEGYWTWGAPYNDFSVYPFSIYTNNGGFIFVSQTAGTYSLQIQAVAKTVETSSDFSDAVNSCVNVASSAILCVPNVTHLDDVLGKGIPFFFNPDYTGSIFIITTIGSPCVIFPESSTITASFSRDDGIFHVVTS